MFGLRYCRVDRRHTLERVLAEAFAGDDTAAEDRAPRAWLVEAVVPEHGAARDAARLRAEMDRLWRERAEERQEEKR